MVSPQTRAKLYNPSGLTSDASIAWGSESGWLTYFRMLGGVTAPAVGLATLFHQLHCELSGGVTHWLAACILVLLAALSMFVVVHCGRRLGGLLKWFTVTNGTLILLGLALGSLCETHMLFGLMLLSINVVAHLFLFNKSARYSGVEDQVVEPEEVEVTGESARQISELPEANSSCESLQIEAKPFWVKHAGKLVLGAACFIYMVLMPTFEMIYGWFTPVTSRELTEMTLSESIRLYTVSGFVMLVFLGMGASIGSFLNVVIYRLPRFLPLLWPPSACTKCRTRLSGKDNIPVLAWLKLGGKCRYCQTSVSARYPLVEALVAIVFVVFYYRELLSGGVNLPVREPNFYHGIVWILLYTKWDLVALYLFHMFLVLVLFSWGMINHDRFRVPPMSAFIVTAVVFMLAVLFPFLNPTSQTWDGFLSGVPASLLASSVGCVGGFILGLFIDWVLPLRVPDEERFVGEPKPLNQASDLSTVVATLTTPELAICEDSTAQMRDAYGELAKTPRKTGDAAMSLAAIGAAMGFHATFFVAVVGIMLYLAFMFVVGTSVKLKSLQSTLPPTMAIFVSALVLLFFWESMYEFGVALLEQQSHS